MGYSWIHHREPWHWALIGEAAEALGLSESWNSNHWAQTEAARGACRAQKELLPLQTGWFAASQLLLLDGLTSSPSGATPRSVPTAHPQNPKINPGQGWQQRELGVSGDIPGTAQYWWGMKSSMWTVQPHSEPTFRETSLVGKFSSNSDICRGHRWSLRDLDPLEWSDFQKAQWKMANIWAERPTAVSATV